MRPDSPQPARAPLLSRPLQPGGTLRPRRPLQPHHLCPAAAATAAPAPPSPGPGPGPDAEVRSEPPPPPPGLGRAPVVGAHSPGTQRVGGAMAGGRAGAAAGAAPAGPGPSGDKSGGGGGAWRGHAPRAPIGGRCRRALPEPRRADTPSPQDPASRVPADRGGVSSHEGRGLVTPHHGCASSRGWGGASTFGHASPALAPVSCLQNGAWTRPHAPGALHV